MGGNSRYDTSPAARLDLGCIYHFCWYTHADNWNLPELLVRIDRLLDIRLNLHCLTCDRHYRGQKLKFALEDSRLYSSLLPKFCHLPWVVGPALLAGEIR